MWSPAPCDVLAADWVGCMTKGLDYRRELRDWSGSSSPLSRKGYQVYGVDKADPEVLSFHATGQP